MENMKSIIGNNIQFLRKQRGWTLQKLSSQIGITYQQLSRIENGFGTSSTTLERIATILGVDLSALMTPLEDNLKKEEFSKYKIYIPEPLLNEMYQTFYNQIIKLSNDAIINRFISNFSMVPQETDWIQEIIFKHTGKKENYHFTEEELLCLVQKLFTEFAFRVASLPRIDLEEKEEEEQ